VVKRSSFIAAAL